VRRIKVDDWCPLGSLWLVSGQVVRVMDCHQRAFVTHHRRIAPHHSKSLSILMQLFLSRWSEMKLRALLHLSLRLGW